MRVLEEHPAGVDLHCTLPVVFGQTAAPHLRRLAELAFELYPSPLLSVEFDARKRRVKRVRVATAKDIRFDTGNFFREALERWLFGPRTMPPQRSRPRLAILHDPVDLLPPSKPQTLERFRQVGGEMGLDVELIRHRDSARLTTFDALFIRETTGVMRPSYQLAAKAEALGMPVIDDTRSILHCCNKVYLAELLGRHGVAAPRTIVTDGRDLHAAAEALGYPLVLKLPDGCSSKGVFKAETTADLVRVARPLLDASHLIVAQEYVYTPFDWRVTVLAGQALFACRYRMAEGHWQIFRHGTDSRPDEGRTEAVAVATVPRPVLDAALQAAALIGDGLYGVDVKETESGVFVIEVNDNPNIDVGLEDAVLGDALYRTVLQEFLTRIDARRKAPRPFFRSQPWSAPKPSVRAANAPACAGDGTHGRRSGAIGMRRHRI